MHLTTIARPTVCSATPESLFNTLKYIDTLQTHSLKRVSRADKRINGNVLIDGNMSIKPSVLTTLTLVCDALVFEAKVQR